MKEFYCPSSKVAIYEGKNPVSRDVIADLTVDKLFGYNIRVHNTDIKLETLEEDHIGFNFNGATFNKRFERRAPARELLDSLVTAAGYYNPQTQEFYF